MPRELFTGCSTRSTTRTTAYNHCQHPSPKTSPAVMHGLPLATAISVTISSWYHHCYQIKPHRYKRDCRLRSRSTRVTGLVSDLSPAVEDLPRTVPPLVQTLRRSDHVHVAQLQCRLANTVVVSWPPAAIPLASQPSNRIGRSSALAAYTAAVWAAGPEPMIQTGVVSVSSCPILSKLAGLVCDDNERNAGESVEPRGCSQLVRYT